MKKIIGIRYEDKYVMERRVPLIPIHVRKLVMEQGLQVYIETSAKRVYEDEEFENAGAHVTYDLQECPVIFGVKEIPIAKLEPEKTYIFFAHVIKGQPHNMPMLRRLMELKCNLIDYEQTADILWPLCRTGRNDQFTVVAGRAVERIWNRNASP
jgi:alpha-aminoadipic semialdehyde synthase